MQAIVLREYGGPETLRLETLADPGRQPGEVVVELRAAALNRRDTYVRKGGNPFPLPLVPGSDGAGVQRETGEEVVILPSLHWGEREEAPGPGFEILGGPTHGTYAELVVVPAANVFPKPKRLSWAQAAAFPLAALTAYRALFCRARLHGGETVLILGAGSGVSTFAVSLACQAGARVIVTSSNAEKLARARELGAHEGVDYTAGDWVEEVRSLTGGAGVDVVVDSVGSTWADSLRCVRSGGRVVAFGATGGATAELEIRPFYFGQFSLLGTTMGSPSRLRGAPARDRRRALGASRRQRSAPRRDGRGARAAGARRALRQARARDRLSVAEELTRLDATELARCAARVLRASHPRRGCGCRRPHEGGRRDRHRQDEPAPARPLVGRRFGEESLLGAAMALEAVNEARGLTAPL